jgi:hypothetical protein
MEYRQYTHTHHTPYTLHSTPFTLHHTQDTVFTQAEILLALVGTIFLPLTFMTGVRVEAARGVTCVLKRERSNTEESARGVTLAC